MTARDNRLEAPAGREAATPLLIHAADVQLAAMLNRRLSLSTTPARARRSREASQECCFAISIASADRPLARPCAGPYTRSTLRLPSPRSISAVRGFDDDKQEDRTRRFSRAAVVLLGWSAIARAESGFCEKRAIFPINPKHNHASCVVQTKDGSLLAAWYAGSGERKSDDVVIEGAWLAAGQADWGPKFLMADTPGYPGLQSCALRRARRFALAVLADDPRPPLGRGSAQVRPLRAAARPGRRRSNGRGRVCCT